MKPSHLIAKSLMTCVALGSLSSGVAHASRGTDSYVYTDEGETRICLSLYAAQIEAQIVPYGGKLCVGSAKPYVSGVALRTMYGGDACSFKNSKGVQVTGTKYSCASNEVLLMQQILGSNAIGNSAQAGGTIGSLFDRFLPPQKVAQSALGKPATTPANSAQQKLVDEFVTTLLEQHPHLLLYPERYPMTKIRAAMTKAAAAYSKWWAANPAMQAKASSKIPDLALKRAFAGQFDPAYADELSRGNAMVIFDLTKPDTEKRFYVVNLSTMKTVRYLVKHGKGSGTGEMAVRVSNRPNSNMTPFGFHFTGAEMWSRNLRRMKIILEGLESINDNSLDRGILIHPSAQIDDQDGEIAGNTLGCAGLDPDTYKALAPVLKGGNLVLFYHRELESAYKAQRNQEIFKERLAQFAQN